MIKLKDIIIETMMGRVGWTTESGTPDEVINIVHEIVGLIIRMGGSKNVNKFINLSHLDDSWVVSNPYNDNVLIYNTHDKTWASADEIYNLTPGQLKIKIYNWFNKWET